MTLIEHLTLVEETIDINRKHDLLMSCFLSSCHH